MSRYFLQAIHQRVSEKGLRGFKNFGPIPKLAPNNAFFLWKVNKKFPKFVLIGLIESDSDKNCSKNLLIKRQFLLIFLPAQHAGHVSKVQNFVISQFGIFVSKVFRPKIKSYSGPAEGSKSKVNCMLGGSILVYLNVHSIMHLRCQ